MSEPKHRYKHERTGAAVMGHHEIETWRTVLYVGKRIVAWAEWVTLARERKALAIAKKSAVLRVDEIAAGREARR